MKFVASNGMLFISFLGLLEVSKAFVSPHRTRILPHLTAGRLFSSTKEKTEEQTENEKVEQNVGSKAASEDNPPAVDPDAEGLPWWWELVWKLDMMKKGEEGTEIIFGDSGETLVSIIHCEYVTLG